MDTRLLIMELGVKIQEKVRELPPAEPVPDVPISDAGAAPADGSVPAASDLKVTVDEVPPAGALVSGKATFSDGQTVQWLMDQMGRFRMLGPSAEYQPPPADIPLFQRELDTLLQLRGF